MLARRNIMSLLKHERQLMKSESILCFARRQDLHGRSAVEDDRGGYDGLVYSRVAHEKRVSIASVIGSKLIARRLDATKVLCETPEE